MTDSDIVASVGGASWCGLPRGCVLRFGHGRGDTKDERGRAMRVSIRSGDKVYCAVVSRAWAIRRDNFALVSCGLTVGRDGFTQRMLDGLLRRGQAVEVSQEEYRHSGCQSRCVRRGDAICQW